MINFEEEIAKRDARIAELEKESVQDTKAINDLLASIHELKAQQPSAGVADERAIVEQMGDMAAFMKSQQKESDDE